MTALESVDFDVSVSTGGADRSLVFLDALLSKAAMLGHAGTWASCSGSGDHTHPLLSFRDPVVPIGAHPGGAVC